MTVATDSLTPSAPVNSRPELPVIHAVTTDDVVRRNDFVLIAQSVMRALGPQGAVHLRASSIDGRRLLVLATALAELQESTGAWLVVNDRIDVALCAGARAVQLTTRSLTVADAQAAMQFTTAANRPAVGASVHNVDDARAAAGGAGEAPAWLIAGHVFATPSHPDAPGRGASALQEICNAVQVPVIAIGGVQPADIHDLLAVGAYGVAAIRGIWRAVDAERAAGDYLSAYAVARDARAGGRRGSDDR